MGTIINKPWRVENILYEYEDYLVKELVTQDKLSIQMHTSKLEVFVGISRITNNENDIFGLYYVPTHYHKLLEFLDELKHNLPKAINMMSPMHIGKLFNYRIVPGTIHFICSGFRVIEISKGLNETIRLYDWNRNDPQRPLDIQTALNFYKDTLN